MKAATDKVLDGLAWLIGAAALGTGLLSASAVGLFGVAWLADRRSFRSLVWVLTDPIWLGSMAEGLAAATLTSLAAIALVRRRRREIAPVSMAAFALKLGRWGLAAAGLAGALTGIPLACRLADALGLR